MWKMKLLKLCFIISLTFSFTQAQVEIFEEANALYQNAEYEQAIKKYEQMLKSDLFSENLHYNLGNAFYHTDQVGLSILHLEKALKLNPGSKRIEHNLRLSYLKTKEKIEPLPRLFFVSWWYSLLSKNNASQWGKRAIFAAFISLALLVFFKFYKNSLLQYLAIFMIITSISLAFLANRKYQYDYKHRFAILMMNEAELKETPNETAKPLATIYEGFKLEIIDQVDDWSQVKLDDGSEAWVLTKALTEI
jgi:tetratricopeptide (TPR) repeat protein